MVPGRGGDVNQAGDSLFWWETGELLAKPSANGARLTD